MKVHRWITILFCIVFLTASLGMPIVPARAQATAASLTPLDQYGGVITRVTVSGPVAYVGMGRRLVLLGLNDPLHPVYRSQSELLPGNVSAIAVRAGFAYVGDSAGNLHVFNVSDPFYPDLLLTLVLPAAATDMDLDANSLLIAEGNHGVEAYSLSNPALPQFVILRTCPGFANGVTSAASGVFVACSAGGAGFYEDFYDAGIAGTAYGFDAPAEALDIAVSGAYVLVVTGPEGLTALELTTDHEGHYLLSYRDDLWITRNSMRIAVSGAYAYIAVQDTHYWYAGFDGSSLVVVNIADPAHLTTAGYNQYKGDSLDVALSGSAAYLAGMDGGLWVMDASNPQSPFTTDVVNPLGAANHLEARAGALYAAAGVQGFVALTADANGQLNSSGQYLGPTTQYTRWVDVQGDYAYLADDKTTLSILDISNPAAPAFTGSYDSNYDGMSVVADGDTLYLSDWVNQSPYHARLLALDGAQPANPQLLQTVDLPSNGTKMTVADGYLYVPNWSSGGVRIFGLPNLNLAGFSTAAPYPISVSVKGNTAYVLNMDSTPPYDGPENAIYVLDVTNKAAPSLIRTIPLDGEAYNMWLDGRSLYVAACEGGLHVYDLGTPTAPQETFVYTLPGCTSDGAARGNLVYAATLDGGVYSFWYQNPVTAVIPVAGGSLWDETGSLRLDFGADTFAQPTGVEIRRPLPAEMPPLGREAGRSRVFGGAYFTVSTAENAVPAKPFTITLTYEEAYVQSVDSANLALYTWDGVNWVREPTSAVDAATHTVTASVQHTGSWALLGSAYQVFLPQINH